MDAQSNETSPFTHIAQHPRPTSMLHLPDCSHFYDTLPPRPATALEAAGRPVCADCQTRAEL